MANDKKFIAKNGLLTPQRAIIGTTTDNNSDTLQVTGSSNLSGTILISQAGPGVATLDVVNSGAGGFNPQSTIATFRGDANALQIANLVTGDYKIFNTGINNGIVLYNDAAGVAIQYNGSDRLVISSTGNDFKGLATSTIDGNRIITVLDQASEGGSFDAATLDGLDSTQFLRSDEDDTMFGSLTITGDLTVSGNTTTVNTEEILLADNLITLNSNYTGSNPSEDAGIEVERGTLTNVVLQWNEGNDYWEIASGGVTGRIITTGDEGANNGFDADSVDGLDAWQFLRSDVDDTAQGNIRIKGDLTVGDDGGGAQIIFDGAGQDRPLYANNGEIGFLNAGFNYSAKSDTNDNWVVLNDVQAGQNVTATAGDVSATAGNVTAGDSITAQNNITATTGDITASAGNVTAQVNVTATTGNVSATAGDVTAGNNITAQNNITATAGDITASAGAVSAATTVTAGTNVIGQKFVDADNNSYEVDPSANSTMHAIGIDDDLFHNGDVNTKLSFATDDISLQTGGAERLGIDNDSVDSTVTFTAPNIGLDTNLFHNGDTDTLINFDTATINLDTDGVTRLTANNSGVTVFGNLGVTGDINAGGDVYASIYYDADDNNYYADPNGTSVMKTIGIDDYIVHNGDSDTKIGFLQNDTLQMDAGGTTIFLAQSTAAEFYVDVYGEGAYFRKYYDNDNNAYFLDPGDTTLSLNVAGRARTGDGTAALPAYSFINDTNTGMYRKGADQIGFSAGGNEELVVYNNRVEAPGSVKSPIFYDLDNDAYYGDFASTSQMSRIDIDDYIRHRGDTNTYMGFDAADNWGVWTGGTKRLGIDTDSADFTVDVYAPKFIDSDNNSYYLDPANADLSATLSGGIRIHTINDYDRWSDSAGDGGIALVGPGDDATGQSTTVAISGNNTGSYALMYLNRIDPNANPFNAGNRYIEFRHDGTAGTNLSGDNSGNLYWLLASGKSKSFWTQAGTALLTINDNGDIVINGSSATYTDGGDNTPLVAAIDSAKLHVDGSIYLNGANNGIIFGRGTASFLRDEELGFGWGGGWYMTDATYLRVRNNKTLLSTGGGQFSGDIYANRYYDVNATNRWIEPGGGGILAGNFEFAPTDTGTSYSTAAIEIRESNYSGASGTQPRLGFHWGGRVASQIALENTGRIVIRNNPGNGYEAFGAGNIYGSKFWDIDNIDYSLEPEVNSAWRLQTTTGYLDFGSMNASYLHFQTDRPTFYFNKPVAFDGNIFGYNGNETASFARYYDSNDPTFWADPHSESIFNTLKLYNKAAPENDWVALNIDNGDGTGDIDQPESWIAFSFRDGNANYTPQVRIGGRAGYNTGSADNLDKEGSGNFIVQTSIGSGGAGAGTIRDTFSVDYLGNSTSINSSRAPIFYDWTNTNWYADPDGDSRLNTITLDGNAVQLREPTGDYGSFMVDGGGRGGWEGFSIGGRVVFMHNNSSAVGMYNDVDNEWLMRFDLNGSNDFYYNGVIQGQTQNGYFLANNEIRSPIFRDTTSPNTWFVDPSGTSRVNTLRTNRLYPAYDNDTSIFIDYVGGDYGSLQINGNGKNGWRGWSLLGHFVWMTPGDAVRHGMYNDVDNQWQQQWYRGAGTRLYYAGGEQFSTENGYALATNQMRAPIYHPPNSTTWRLDLDAGNTSYGLRLPGIIRRDNFQTSGDGNNNVLLDTQDYTHWIWRTANNWGIMWAGNNNPYRSYFSTTNPNEIVFIGSGNLRASIDLDTGDAHFTGKLTAPEIAISGNAQDISLNPAYGSGGADLVLFDYTPYAEAEISSPVQGAESISVAQSEYVEVADAPFAGKVIQTSAYRVIYSDYIPVVPGEDIYGEISVRRVSGSGGLLYYGVERFDKDKRAIAGNTGTTYFVVGGTNYTSTGWTTYRNHTTIPTSHTPYNGSDGGGCHYVRIRILLNYNSGGALRQFGGIMLKRRNVESNLLVDNIVANDILADDITADLIDAYQFRDRDSTSYFIEPANASRSARFRGEIFIGPNQTWGDYIQIGGNGREYVNNAGVASVVTTDGNLHIDAASGHQTYINYYDGDNIYFGNGGNGTHSRWQSNGDLYIGGGGSAAASGFKLDVNGSANIRGNVRGNRFEDAQDPNNRYVDPASTSQIETLNVNKIKSFPSPDYGQLYFDNAGQVYPSGRSQVVGIGLGIYSAYSGGSGAPYTYDITASFNNNGKAFEIAADWINTNRTPLSVRSLRDCCQNWTPWRQIATAGVNYQHNADIYAYRYYDANDDRYYADPHSRSVMNAINIGGPSNSAGDINMQFGSTIFLRAAGTNNLRGYIQVRDSNDGHLRIATSGGEDIRFMDGGLDGQWNMIIRGNGNTLINNYIDATRFRDRNDPNNYYGDFASTSLMNVVDVNRLRTRNSTGYFWDGNEDLSMLVYGEIANSNYAAGNLQPGALNIGHTNRDYRWEGTSWAGSINVGILANCSNYWEMAVHDSGTSVESLILYNAGDIQMGRNIGWGTSRIVHPGGTASTIYTDWTNTGYYLDPDATQSSNINGFSARTQAMMGLPGHTRNSGQYYRARPRITGDSNYWTGAYGWSRVDMNTVSEWGSGFIDSWSNPPNQPSGTSHWVGAQAFHYNSGSYHYGWQLVGGPIAGLRFRNTWGPSFSSWKHITMYGVNDAPGGSSGYLYAERFVNTPNTGYYGDFDSTSRMNVIDINEGYTRGWWRNYNSGQGLYNQANGRHFYSPGNVYWHIDGRGDVGGLIFYDRYQSSQGSSTGRRGYVYYDGSGFGLLGSNGGWALRIQPGNPYHELYGTTYANTLRAYIFYDRNNGSSYYSDPGSTSRLNVSITNTSYFGNNTNRGYAEQYSTYNSGLRRIGYITMNNGSSSWNDSRFHGIASTDYNANFSDSISINSYNDINLRLDSNSNNGSSYVRIHDNSRVNGLNVAYIGRENGSAIAYFYNRVYGAIFYDHSSSYYGDFASTSRLNQLTVNRINSPYAGGNSGITRSSSAYSFGFQESGGWTYPYPDLVLQYHTGMSFAANPSYGGMRFFNDYNSSTVRFQINGGSSYTYANTWLQVGGGGVGIYDGYNGAHFYPNNSTNYGSWNFLGSRSGWRGIAFSDAGYDPHLMWDSSGNGGWYHEDIGRWLFYHSRSRNCTGVGSSSTVSGYRMRVNGSLYCNGNVVAYSDRRKKKNIVTIDGALDKVLALRGVYYERIEDLVDERDDLYKGRQVGMIAQEVLEVVPEVVSYAEELDEYALDYPKMVGLLVEAHKDQQEIINNQQKEIDTLKEMVYNMMQKMENL